MRRENRGHAGSTMAGRLRLAGGLAAVAVLLALIGCDRGDKPEKPPAVTERATESKPKLTLIAIESADWSRAEALGRLADEKSGISAAVRLVRLAEACPLCVPQEITDATAARLRVVQLSDTVWALGLADRRSERVLRAPVLIGADGEVTVVADGTEEEALTLHVSPDADVFPHLLISPWRVLLAEVPPRLALTLKSPDIVGFSRKEQEGYAYVGLMLHGEQGWVEVARYRWEPYELALAGPASDKLPDPPGGKFVLDMEASPLLIPEGGEIPEPDPIKQEPPPSVVEPDSLDA